MKSFGHKFSLGRQELQTFALSQGFAEEVLGRMSLTMLGDLFLRTQFRLLDPSAVNAAIQKLESPETQVTERMFMHLPLKGLWKTHYFQAAFIPMNIASYWGAAGAGSGNRKLDSVVSTWINENEGQSVSDSIGGLVDAIVDKPFFEKRRRGKLTGEWIVYAKRGGERYYLTLAEHKEGDQKIHDRVVKCMREFPFLCDNEGT